MSQPLQVDSFFKGMHKIITLMLISHGHISNLGGGSLGHAEAVLSLPNETSKGPLFQVLLEVISVFIHLCICCTIWMRLKRWQKVLAKDNNDNVNIFYYLIYSYHQDYYNNFLLTNFVSLKLFYKLLLIGLFPVNK